MVVVCAFVGAFVGVLVGVLAGGVVVGGVVCSAIVGAVGDELLGSVCGTPAPQAAFSFSMGVGSSICASAAGKAVTPDAVAFTTSFRTWGHGQQQR